MGYGSVEAAPADDVYGRDDLLTLDAGYHGMDATNVGVSGEMRGIMETRRRHRHRHGLPLPSPPDPTATTPTTATTATTATATAT